MDKGWMDLPRSTTEYRHGVNNFIEFAFTHSAKGNKILCPCKKEAFPEGAALPKNFYEAKKTVKSLGLGYINIHACENDCILFWKQYENYTSCPK
uniref:Transposase-associated domain-containing protein n=1 Tax=Oryza rufipogon TaxID=4529 RepID=A0A0E0PYI0_ORYRU